MTAALITQDRLSTCRRGAPPSSPCRGQNGFADVSRFLDNLATYVIYLAIPAGVLAIIAAGGMLITGNPDGTTWLARTAVGVGIVLLAKGIMA